MCDATETSWCTTGESYSLLETTTVARHHHSHVMYNNKDQTQLYTDNRHISTVQHQSHTQSHAPASDARARERVVCPRDKIARKRRHRRRFFRLQFAASNKHRPSSEWQVYNVYMLNKHAYLLYASYPSRH